MTWGKKILIDSSLISIERFWGSMIDNVREWRDESIVEKYQIQFEQSMKDIREIIEKDLE